MKAKDNSISIVFKATAIMNFAQILVLAPKAFNGEDGLLNLNRHTGHRRYPKPDGPAGRHLSKES
jgi:hypothetical protein